MLDLPIESNNNFPIHFNMALTVSRTEQFKIATTFERGSPILQSHNGEVGTHCSFFPLLCFE